jgi:hypothetical protein
MQNWGHLKYNQIEQTLENGDNNITEFITNWFINRIKYISQLHKVTGKLLTSKIYFSSMGDKIQHVNKLLKRMKQLLVHIKVNTL